jgi:hypothetical protein
MTRKWRRLSIVLAVTLFVLAPRSSQAAEATGGGNTTGQATGQTIGPSAITGQTTGSERFLRENREVGQMVGGVGEGVGNLRGATDSAGQGSSDMFGNQGRFSSSNPMMSSFMNSGMFNAMSRQRQQLRVPLRLGPNGVSFSSMAPAVATGPNLRVQNHLARIPHLKSPGSVKVEMEGQVAILRGEVGSQHERDLVARLVLLEPGIADVRNELQVPSAAPAPVPKP